MDDAYFESLERYLNGDEGDVQPWDKTCNQCGTDGLHFEQLGSGKWWLFDRDGQIHKCPISAAGLEKLKGWV
jgi:hypothetical protein